MDTDISFNLICVLLLVVGIILFLYKQFIFNEQIYRGFPLLQNYYFKKDFMSVLQTGFIIFVIITISWIVNRIPA